jgi:hypothetical protein
MTVRVVAGVLAVLSVVGCVKSAEPAIAPDEDQEGYGYENDDDPGATIEAREAKLPTSCADLNCPPPSVCRLLDTTDPGGVAHAYCLTPGEGLCKVDPYVCE